LNGKTITRIGMNREQQLIISNKHRHWSYNRKKNFID